MDGRKTKFVEVSYGRREFLAGLVVLAFCLSLFCTDARALYSYVDIESSGAYGFSDSSVTLDGPEFGVIGAVADDGDTAYGIYASEGGITINGDIGSGGSIFANALYNYAYSIYAPVGSIDTDALNGAISAAAGSGWAIGLTGGGITTGRIGGSINVTTTYQEAYGLYSWDNDISTGDITGSLNVVAGSYNAYGLYSEDTSINTGNITGMINVVAGQDNAYGFWANNGITTGEITGTIAATATTGSYAFGMDSGGDMVIDGNIGSSAVISATAEDSEAIAIRGGSLTIGDIDDGTGDIDGTISAEVTNGNRASALRSMSDMTINGDIGSTAVITATAANSGAYGLCAGGSLTTQAINGTISAEATNGSRAFALYSASDMYVGDIGSDAEITAYAYYDRAFGLLSEGSLTASDINGTITATAANGSYAYGLYANSELTVGNIDDDAYISAIANDSYAAGLYAGGPSTVVVDGDINGTIYAETTNGDYAYGIYSSGDITVDNINYPASITAVAGGNDAAGLYSENGSITTGMINGDISATANGLMVNESAYGLYADVNISTGSIDGTISAEMTNGSGAYGMYAGGDITINDGIGPNAEITAIAGEEGAYGLYAGGNISITGSSYPYYYLSGDISATAGDSWAYGMNSGGTIDIFAIYGGDISATATNGSDAYGLNSGSNMTIDYIYYSDISATAGTNNAFGLRSDGTIEIGWFNDSTISATATAGSGAYGIYANSIEIDSIDYYTDITAWAGGSDASGMSAGSITTGAIDGYISATANTGSNATGIGAGSMEIDSIGSDAEITAWAQSSYARGLWGGSIDIYGNIDGEITAEVNNGPYAYGLNTDGSEGGDIDIGGDIDGTITATAAEWKAVGLYSSGDGSIYVDGDISGDITAEAGGSSAFGLRTDNTESTIDIGSISGTITATAGNIYGGDRAYGLRSAGSINVYGDISGDVIARAYGNEAVGLSSAGSMYIDAISGNIDANADGDFAYGVLSYGPMDVTVDGGTISAVANGGINAAAIQSGQVSGGTLITQPADDDVEIVAGSTIVGDIDLANNDGGDYDQLTLTGNDWDSTTFADDIMNVEWIDIYGGHWFVDGTVSDNAYGTTVYGGILSGTGWLENVSVEGGTLAPGDSVGTINIDGDLSFDEDSTFEVEVDQDGYGDQAYVTGAATVDGKIRVLPIDWPENHLDYDTPFEVTIIDAESGLDGEFAELEGGTAFLLLDVDYDYEDYDVILSVDQITDFAYYATTKNQASIGEAFNSIDTPSLTGDMKDVVDEILMLPDGDAVNEAYNQMMPQDALGLPEVTRQMMNQFLGGVSDHMDNVRGSKQYAMLSGSRYLLASAGNSLAAPPETDKWMPFVKGFGTWGNRDGESDIVGYDYDSYGVMGGMDNLVSENTLIGFSAGGSSASVDYDQASTSADIDSLLVSLYGSYFKDNWHVDLTLGYAHNWYDSQRGVLGLVAESDHQGDTFAAAIEFGNNFGGTEWLLEPVAGVGYTSVSEDSYKEKGAGPLSLDVDSQTIDGLYSKLGLRVGKEFRSEKNPDVVWVPKASAFWIHDFADRVELDSSFVGGGSFTTEGLEPVEDVFNIGAGLNVYFGKDTRLFVDYGWQTASNFNSNTVQAGVQWSF